MSSCRLTIRLLPEEARMLAMASAMTGRSKADLVRSILFPVLESLVTGNSVCYADKDEFTSLWNDLSKGKTSEDRAFEQKMLKEEERFWTS